MTLKPDELGENFCKEISFVQPAVNKTAASAVDSTYRFGDPVDDNGMVGHFDAARYGELTGAHALPHVPQAALAFARHVELRLHEVGKR